MFLKMIFWENDKLCIVQEKLNKKKNLRDKAKVVVYWTRET